MSLILIKSQLSFSYKMRNKFFLKVRSPFFENHLSGLISSQFLDLVLMSFDFLLSYRHSFKTIGELVL